MFLLAEGVLFIFLIAEAEVDPEVMLDRDTEDVDAGVVLISEFNEGSAFAIIFSVEFCTVTGFEFVGSVLFDWLLWNDPNIKAPPNKVLANNVNQNSGKTLSCFLWGSWTSIASHRPSRTGTVWL